MKLFEPYTIKNMTLKNRIVLPPMCMYRATDGEVNDFHLVHYATRAQGGTGLLIVEATGVSPEGRISDTDLGIYEDRHTAGLKKLVDTCHAFGSQAALQINHAGRKSTTEHGPAYAPSALQFDDSCKMPLAMGEEDISRICSQFAAAAKRADEAGFDAIEIHGAHGYLIHEFLSPLTNRRKDAYGGDTAGRVRFLQETLRAIRTVWPSEKPILLRVSADDYGHGGLDKDEMAHIIDYVKNDVDMVHVSTGGLLPSGVSAYPGYQVPHCETIRNKCDVPTIAVGLITEATMAEEILRSERADLVALGRELLRNPYWPIYTAKKNGVDGYVPIPYERGFK
ncbi:MAG: NADPH dehydrogenase NamA [Christensenellales bacterium]|jgi:NADPH2 dehydrogenase